jgi:beta-1,4-mannosyl-glycoprotein beta-1,4-N-acetylglucosaminyltransferase
MDKIDYITLKSNKPEGSKVIDCFTFYNELDMLEFRLMELDDVVDTFIIVEATLTHSGLPKELNFHKNKHRFSKWLHKIHYYVVDDLPMGISSAHDWFREEYQRDNIKFALEQISPKPNDIIIISDLDEIPNSLIINHFRTNPLFSEGALGLCMDWYYYNLTTGLNIPPTKNSKILYYQKLLTLGLTPSQIRLKEWISVSNAGWHLTFFMSVDKIITKLESYAHQEFNTSEVKNPEALRKLITEGKDIFPNRSESDKFYQKPLKENSFLPKNYKFWLENSRTL